MGRAISSVMPANFCSRTSGAAILLILATTVCLAQGPAPARSDAADFYVSPRGADTWSGARTHPNADQTDGPFATLARARDAARSLKLGGTNTRPMTVLVRGGEYRLTSRSSWHPPIPARRGAR